MGVRVHYPDKAKDKGWSQTQMSAKALSTREGRDRWQAFLQDAEHYGKQMLKAIDMFCVRTGANKNGLRAVAERAYWSEAEAGFEHVVHDGSHVDVDRDAVARSLRQSAKAAMRSASSVVPDSAAAAHKRASGSRAAEPVESSRAYCEDRIRPPKQPRPNTKGTEPGGMNTNQQTAKTDAVQTDDYQQVIQEACGHDNRAERAILKRCVAAEPGHDHFVGGLSIIGSALSGAGQQRRPDSQARGCGPLREAWPTRPIPAVARPGCGASRGEDRTHPSIQGDAAGNALRRLLATRNQRELLPRPRPSAGPLRFGDRPQTRLGPPVARRVLVVRQRRRQAAQGDRPLGQVVRTEAASLGQRPRACWGMNQFPRAVIQPTFTTKGTPTMSNTTPDRVPRYVDIHVLHPVPYSCLNRTTQDSPSR